MVDVTFDEVFELAKQLDPAQRLLLAMRLEKSIPTAERDVGGVHHRHLILIDGGRTYQ